MEGQRAVQAHPDRAGRRQAGNSGRHTVLNATVRKREQPRRKRTRGGTREIGKGRRTRRSCLPLIENTGRDRRIANYRRTRADTQSGRGVLLNGRVPWLVRDRHRRAIQHHR